MLTQLDSDLDGAWGRLAHSYARFVAGACLVVGIVGLFVTGFDYYSNVTGVGLLAFTVNPNTNVIHIIVGLVGIALGTSATRSRVFLLLCGALGIPWAIYGYIVEDTMADYFGRNPTLVTTHLVLSVAALVLAAGPDRLLRRSDRAPTGRADASAGVASGD